MDHAALDDSIHLGSIDSVFFKPTEEISTSTFRSVDRIHVKSSTLLPKEYIDNDHVDSDLGDAILYKPTEEVYMSDEFNASNLENLEYEDRMDSTIDSVFSEVLEDHTSVIFSEETTSKNAFTTEIENTTTILNRAFKISTEK